MKALIDHPLVGEVRACGLVGAVELVKESEGCTPLQPVGEVGEIFRSHGLAHGIITRPVGETVTLMPPLIITHEQVDFLVEKFLLSLDSFQAGLGDSSSPNLAQK